MIKVHLYGKLRRFTSNQDPFCDSIVYVPVEEENTIASILRYIGIPFEELGSNIFLNSEYSDLDRKVKD